jgi:hypothetical protein
MTEADIGIERACSTWSRMRLRLSSVSGMVPSNAS